MTRTGFPFTAVVGMDDLRLALLLNAVSPAVGGVLVRGEKGTAKSTMVRALAAALPEVAVVAGCRFSCDPAAPDLHCPDGPHDDASASTRLARLVELPVGATEDRLIGSLDLERALTSGVRSFEPGILAAAHRGLLYVDEVNLLHDHLVDLLLDAAALGVSYVERDGMSVQHASRFLLVGTMNPEEGELRPQLLDRFGLTVDVAAPRDPEVRAVVVRRRLAFEADPVAFVAEWVMAESELAADVRRARTRLAEVNLGEIPLRQITTVCAAAEVDGMRADLVMARTAIAHAAWCGRINVDVEDVRVAARLALPHRRRRQPFDAPDDSKVEQAIEDALATGNEPPDSDSDGAQDDGPEDDGPEDDGPEDDGPCSATRSDAQPQVADDGARNGSDSMSDAGRRASESVAPVGSTFRARLLKVPGMGVGAAGRRSPARTAAGRLVADRVPTGRPKGIHVVSTLLAAAPHQLARGREPGSDLELRAADLREPVREGRESNLIVFVVDASGSMAARARMSAVKGATAALLLDAYQRRDKVAVITFRGVAAEVVLPPTSSVEVAARSLQVLAAGGRTPIAAGLLRARTLLQGERLRDPLRRPLLVLITDGRATGESDSRSRARAAAAALSSDGVAAVVVDCESGPVRLGLARELARDLRAPLFGPQELSAVGLAAAVREQWEVA